MQQETQPQTQQETPVDEVTETTETTEAAQQQEETPSEPQPSPAEIIADLEDKWRRALAETHNVRRRAEEEYRNALRYGIRAFARDMLSVCDNLGRAMESAQSAKSDELLQGIQAIQRELHDIMERHGVRQMQPLGEKFDPNYHEAVFEVQQDDKPEFDKVVQVAQPGYMIGERLLRPARVGIARATPGIRAKDQDETAAAEIEQSTEQTAEQATETSKPCA